jgi:phosphatidylethanolamine/phosphatidyl-N-methylethanolamine N-methyltransferase
MRNRSSERLRFIGQWLKNPRQTASVTPSSPGLASAMLAQLPPDTRRVIELGGGTGALTRALVDHGISGTDLLVLELNKALHTHLRLQFPDEVLVHGDAGELPRLAASAGFLGAGPADAVVSGLGLLAIGREQAAVILQGAFECLRPDGRFIQFTYGPMSPISDGVLGSLGLNMRRGEFVLRNVPPATVWVYQRNQSKSIVPRSVNR